MRIPFGIAQIGKAFRNEIIARQFIFRMREFEQMEMQFFVSPKSEMEWYKKWKNTRIKWHHILNLGKDRYRFHDHKNCLCILVDKTPLQNKQCFHLP